VPDSAAPTVLCIATYEKGQEFILECKRQGCQVLLLTVETLKDADWPRDVVDRFIMSRLDKARFAPAEEVDRATLLRRVSFDLVGLPPTPAEVQAFLNDDSPTAFARVVDRLHLEPPPAARAAGRAGPPAWRVAAAATGRARA